MGFEATLWLAADKLRNNMDAAEYKHVVLGLIFLKYISDSFEEHHAKLAAGEGEYAGANPEDPDEYRAENIFWVPKEARWSYLQANAKQPSIGKIVDDAMVAIERDNPRLKGVLPKDYARPALDKHRLGELIDLIGTIGLGDKENRAKDILGRVYEYFLTQFASAEGKNGGQFYTPSCVVRVLVEMLAPYKGRVYDPCCGSGGMFIQSEKFVEAHGGRIGDISIYGQESKAINNLLRAVEEVAEERSFRFVGAKKYSKEEDRLNGIMISDERDNEAMESDDWQLLAGTVWLFSREAHDRKIDFLFVDEAGQVSLANVIAMGTSARNIVLLGRPDATRSADSRRASRRVRKVFVGISAAGSGHDRARPRPLLGHDMAHASRRLRLYLRCCLRQPSATGAAQQEPSTCVGSRCPPRAQAVRNPIHRSSTRCLLAIEP